MFYHRKKVLTLWAAIVTALVLAGPTTAVAKPHAGVTGEARLHPGTWNHQRASRHVRHARDYSRDIYRYSRRARKIDPVVAKAESAGLGHNIAQAQKELATARKKAGSDAATIAAIKSIEKHLASAEKQHKVLHAECCKPSVDGKVSMDCCNSIILDLDKARAEHDALLRTLEMKAKTSK